MSKKTYDNIFLKGFESKHGYTSRLGGRSKINIPNRDNYIHGNSIQSKFKKIWEQEKIKEEKRSTVTLTTKKGTYLEFKSSPNFDLTSKSLEDRRAGIKLVNVRQEKDDRGDIINKATVFIPKGKENHFIKKAIDYTDGIKKGKSEKPANTNLIASINDIKVAMIDDFWFGNKEWMPKDTADWCEIWLLGESKKIEEEFRRIAKDLDIEVKQEKIKFPERIVLCCKANRIQLEGLIEETGCIAEIRRATTAVSFFLDLDNYEQSEWINDLRNRIEVDDKSKVVISVLDTGINNGHMLIKPVLTDENCYAYKSEWGNYDHKGHGTEMAGICTYGNLEKLLENNNKFKINHILESYKILPPNGENEPELYGAITSQSVSNLDINNPNKKRIVCMAITSKEHDTRDGSPTSWSAAIDELTSGYIDGKQKLFILSGGNVKDNIDYKNYPMSNELYTVQNPGQSWNAITVGAYTDKDSENSIAKRGELSPYSSTSHIWNNKWPIKPEVLFEGGNLIEDLNTILNTEDLSVLTTNYQPSKQQFSITWGTSASCAKASWMAAKLQSKYPEAWPETIRALIIHSAEWTKEMKTQFLVGSKKTDYRRLLRCCGYGVPNLDRAEKCINNSINLIIESDLKPFKKEKSRYKTKDMNLHELPWPKEILEDMYDTPVEMKITLSYFIEPSPGEVGWKDKYKYPSCGLRFDVNGLDNKDTFINRISKAINDEENNKESSSGSINWVLGANNRNVGSIHSDIWVGTAAELSTCNIVCVYPVGGWWKERPYLDRWDNKIRYSLIVSISTPKTNVDLYTPIMSKIKAKTKVKIKVKANR